MENPEKIIFLKNKSLYVHIPFCVSKCEYCDFFSVPCERCCFPDFAPNETLLKNKIPDAYVDALCNEIDFRFNFDFGGERKFKIIFDSIYIGGGTPSLLSKNQLKKIFLKIERNPFLKIAENCEITIETNPDDVTERLLSDYSEIGVNRISCGVQSMNEKSLKSVKRRSSARINENAIKILSAWKKDLCVDFICGLPYETEKTFINGLNYVVKSLKNLNHISLYSLAIEDETPLGQKFKNGKFNFDFEKSDEMWLNSRDFLEKNGFFQYEVSNFCKENKESKHNLKYWNRGDYFCAGAGAVGTFYQNDGSGVRWTNVRDVLKYADFWKNFKTAENQKSEKNEDNEKIGKILKTGKDGKSSFENEDFAEIEKIIAEKNQDKRICQTLEKITPEIAEFEYFMTGLRKISGISKNHFEKTFSREIPKNFTNLCENWRKKGLCDIFRKKNDEIFTLGKNGILFLNKFLETLLQNE